MAYATSTDVSTFTGVSVNTAMVTRAQAVIEAYTNRTEAASADFSARDLHWLKMATVFQAAYMQSNPEADTMMDLASLSQQDLSVAFRPGAGIQLSPLARTVLRNLSWLGSRNIRVGKGRTKLRQSDRDEDLDWTPMG